MRVGALGPVVVVSDDGTPVALGEGRVRPLLALLVLHRDRVVRVDEVLDVLWSGAPPATATQVVHNLVAAVRKAAGEALVRTEPGAGYRLGAVSVDADSLLVAATVADDLLSAGSSAAAVSRLEAALALWRGEPFPELPDSVDAAAERIRLLAAREACEELLVDAQLAAGRHALLVPELEAAVRRHPLRERTWAQLATALYRTRGQGEALEAIRRAEHALADGLGVDLGPRLRDLRLAVLQQSPALELAPTEPAPVSSSPSGTWAALLTLRGRCDALDGAQRHDLQVALVPEMDTVLAEVVAGDDDEQAEQAALLLIELCAAYIASPSWRSTVSWARALLPRVSAGTAARLQLVVAVGHHVAAELTEALEAAWLAVTHAEAVGDEALIADALCWLAVNHAEVTGDPLPSSDPEEVLGLLARSAEAWQRADTTPRRRAVGLAATLTATAVHQRLVQEDAERARATLTEALEVVGDHDSWMRSYVLWHQVATVSELGDYAAADALLAELSAIPAGARTQDRVNGLTPLLAGLARRRGRVHEAAEAFRAHLRELVQAGESPSTLALYLVRFGDALCALGDDERGLRCVALGLRSRGEAPLPKRVSTTSADRSRELLGELGWQRLRDDVAAADITVLTEELTREPALPAVALEDSRTG